MSMPAFTAESSLCKSIGRYTMAHSGGFARVESIVEPQYCGPCIGGRRQCGDYQWVCENYCPPGGIICTTHCYQGAFQTYSVPCNKPIPVTHVPGDFRSNVG